MSRHPGRQLRVLAVAVIAGGLFASIQGCSDSSLDLPTSGDLSLELTVTPESVDAGGEVVIVAASVGTQLLGTVLEFGDGTVDSIPAGGAQTQTVTRPRTYPNPGAFVVRATVDDAFQGTLIREDTVTVN